MFDNNKKKSKIKFLNLNEEFEKLILKEYENISNNQSSPEKDL